MFSVEDNAKVAAEISLRGYFPLLAQKEFNDLATAYCSFGMRINKSVTPVSIPAWLKRVET